jgi:hypothetical protein
MHKLTFLVGLVIAVTLLTPSTARSELVSISGQAHVADSDVPDGLAVGVRASVSALFLEGYWDHVSYGSDVSVSRAVVGARYSGGVGRLSLILRAGLGTIHERGGALGAESATPRRGVTARAGAAVEGRLGYGFRLGLGIDTEAYLVVERDRSWSRDNADSGTGHIGSLYLKFELGL